MGGGTGTGASPIVAEVSREVGALTIGVVTRPFGFEGRKRGERGRGGRDGAAREGRHADRDPERPAATISDSKTTLEDAFSSADEVLHQAIQGISEVITVPGIINLDFADVRKDHGTAGPALLAIGKAAATDRAVEAAKLAVTSPLLDVSIKGARGVLFNVVGGRDLGIHEVNAGGFGDSGDGAPRRRDRVRGRDRREPGRRGEGHGDRDGLRGDGGADGDP